MSLVGGHTTRGDDLNVGLAITGDPHGSGVFKKGGAQPGDKIILTKALGTGVILAADMRGLALGQWIKETTESMVRPNAEASDILRRFGASAVTDVTGFGLLGHLTELCEGSGVSAVIDSTAVPRLPNTDHYIAEECTPGGTDRNFDSYGHHLGPLTDAQRALLCDPQTSGGLLVAVAPDGLDAFKEATAELNLTAFGQLTERTEPLITVN